MTLPTNRTTANTAAEHVSDHNTVHGFYNTHPTDPAAHSGTYVAATIVTGTGIDPTGVADSTAAIHALRTAAGVGGTLYFPPGTYKVTGLVANVASQKWIFAQGATLTMVAATVSPIVNVTATGVIIEGGTFNGSGATGNGFSVNSVASAQIRRTTILNTSDHAVFGQDCDRLLLDRNSITATGSTAILVQCLTADVVDVVIRKNRVDLSALNPASSAWGGIGIRGFSTFKMRRAKILANRVYLPTSPTDPSLHSLCIETAVGSPGSIVEGNHTNGGSMGISVAISDNTTVAANYVFGPATAGIEVPQGIGVTVSANTIDGNGICLYGVWIDGNSPYSNGTTVAGNTIIGCATHGVFQVNGNNTTVVGNTIKHDTAGAVDAILLQGVTGFAVAGNSLDGGSVGLRGVQIDTGTIGSITGNVFRNFVTTDVSLLVSSAFTIDHVSITGNSTSRSGALVAISTSGGGAIGTNVTVWSNGDGQFRFNNTNVRFATSTGTPEGATTADVGSTFFRSNGGPGTAAYVKVNGTGNTGWQAIPAHLYKSGAGIVNLVDGDFPATPPDGSMGVAHNTTTGLSYWCARANGTWKAVEIS